MLYCTEIQPATLYAIDEYSVHYAKLVVEPSIIHLIRT
jgi:hypothetical protein